MLESHVLHSSCYCEEGFSQATPTTCSDDDECVLGTDECLQSTCRNTIGSYACDCNEGFEKLSDTECTDIDECAEDENICGEGECFNTVGTYECVCSNGYRFDDITCIGENYYKLI